MGFSFSHIVILKSYIDDGVLLPGIHILITERYFFIDIISAT